MKNLILIALILLVRFNVTASVVYASRYGWSVEDATFAFQTAVNSSADTIIINKQLSDWTVGPNIFTDLHDKTIIFQPGVVFRAKSGAFQGKDDCLLKLERGRNIKIIGYGATFQMNKAEYAALDDSEYRHSISLNNSSNIEIYGLKIIESGGDGISISGDFRGSDKPYCENIILKDLWCESHYRQGISIMSAEHLYVERCWFTNTSGILPMSGVDIEPYTDYQRLVDVKFDKCRFTGNDGNGIQLSLENLSNASLPVDITFRDCYTNNNFNASHPYKSAEIMCLSSPNNAVTGSVKMIRCMIENSKWTAVYIKKTADSFLTTFDNCVFLNVSQRSDQDNLPIFFEASDLSSPCPRFGGAVFTNCAIAYSTSLNFLGSRNDNAYSPGMGNVQVNNLTVINPNTGVSMDTTNGGGSPDSTCQFNYDKYTSAPLTTVTFDAGNELIECDEKSSVLHVMRSSGDLTFPLGVTYNITNEATQGIDYSRMNGFLIIPAGLPAQEDYLSVLVDDIQETAKEITITPNSNQLYTTGSSELLISVTDCTELPSDTEPPVSPSGLKSKHITSSGFTLTWIPSTDNVLVKGYEVFLDTISLGITADTVMVIEFLKGETTYAMRVRAFDLTGNLSGVNSALQVTTSSSLVEGDSIITFEGRPLEETILNGIYEKCDWGDSLWTTRYDQSQDTRILQMKSDATVQEIRTFKIPAGKVLKGLMLVAFESPATKEIVISSAGNPDCSWSDMTSSLAYYQTGWNKESDIITIKITCELGPDYIGIDNIIYGNVIPECTLPENWSTTDIGYVRPPGNACEEQGIFTVSGSGADIWNKADAFRFVYKESSGNTTIYAKVLSVSNTDIESKAGVMIRESLEADSKFAHMCITPSEGASFQYRSETGENCNSVTSDSITAPYWLKLTHEGTEFIGYISPDSITWTMVGIPVNISMDDNVLIGLAVTSHSNGSLCKATFSNVMITSDIIFSGSDKESDPVNISIFPNPMKNILYIDFGAQLIDPVVLIYDMLGTQVLMRKPYNTGIATVDVRDLKRGIYLIKVMNGRNTVVSKLVKE